MMPDAAKIWKSLCPCADSAEERKMIGARSMILCATAAARTTTVTEKNARQYWQVLLRNSMYALRM